VYGLRSCPNRYILLPVYRNSPTVSIRRRCRRVVPIRRITISSRRREQGLHRRIRIAATHLVPASPAVFNLYCISLRQCQKNCVTRLFTVRHPTTCVFTLYNNISVQLVPGESKRATAHTSPPCSGSQPQLSGLRSAALVHLGGGGGRWGAERESRNYAEWCYRGVPETARRFCFFHRRFTFTIGAAVAIEQLIGELLFRTVHAQKLV
jgi:hypothetical protein